jgi:MFS transporter, OPA family, glycerol-3-phosphate transporter
VTVTSGQRTWRTRVFVATWLSYFGFYFCRKPFSSAKHAIGEQYHWSASTLGNIYAAYLIAYSIGQFLASRIGPRLGPRINVLVGMALSIAVTCAMGIELSPWTLAGLIAVNGLAQATGWSGNVGTMASWFAKHERGRVMGVWSTNFTVGAIASGFVMSWVLDVAAWQWCFYVGALVLGAVWIQFYFLQRNRPEDVGLPPIDDPDENAAAFEADAGPLALPRDAWTNMLIVGGFYFFVKLVRYAIWSWAAYFMHARYNLSDSRANLYSTIFDVCGVPGVFLTGWISDRYLGSRRAGIALVMMIGMMVATLLLMMFGGANVTVFVVLLGGVGFFLYGPDALLTGAGAMDIGSKRAATFAAAVISGFGSMGPIVQEVIVPRVYDEKTAGLGPVFGILFASAAAAAVFCLLLVLRNRRGGRGI